MYTKQISTKFSDCQVICWISFERSCKTLQRLRVASLKVAPSGLAKRRRKADFSLRQECQCLDGAEKVKIRQEPRAFKKESAHAGGNWVKPHGGSGVIFASKVATSSAKPKPTLLTSSRGFAGRLELIPPASIDTKAAKSRAAHHLGYETGALGSVHLTITGRRLRRKNPKVAADQ